MSVTVIVCTANRCQSLAKTLDSLAASVLPASVDWEVLVVDNNSRDQTRDVVAEFCSRYPDRFRYLFEPCQGKSYALNSGISEARGTVLAFTDDDVIVEPAWLHNLTANLQDGPYAGAGGRTLPMWTCPRPRWMPLDNPYALAPFAVFDLGPNDCSLLDPPYGANMAFRKTMFDKYGGYRVDLAGTDNLFRNEDTEFGRRLIAAGEHLFYQASAIAYHLVSEQRLQKANLQKWWFDQGRAEIRESWGSSEAKRSSSGIPLRLCGYVVSWTFRWMVAVKPDARFRSKLKVCYRLGQLSESYDLSRLDQDKLVSAVTPEGTPTHSARR